MENKNTKMYIWVLGIIQLAMLIVVFSPLLAASEEFKLAQESLAHDPDQHQLAAWNNQLVQRDFQVCLLCGMLAGLFINSFVMAELINRSLSDNEGFIGAKPAPARGGIRILFHNPGPMVAFSASLTLVITSAIGMSMAYKHQSPLGLWSLVGCVGGITLCVLSLVWASLGYKRCGCN